MCSHLAKKKKKKTERINRIRKHEKKICVLVGLFQSFLTGRLLQSPSKLLGSAPTLILKNFPANQISRVPPG